MKVYCQECGSPIEYVSKKPNFCGNCGYNFVTKAKISSPSQRPAQDLDEDSEENDVKELDPRIYEMQGLDVEISVDTKRKVTFGDIFPDLTQKGDEKQKKNE